MPPLPPGHALSRDNWALNKCKERSQTVLTVKVDTQLTGMQMAKEQTRWQRNRRGGQGTDEVDEVATEQTRWPRNRRSGHGTYDVAKEQTKWPRKRRADRWLTRVIFLRVLSKPTQLPKERLVSEPTPLSQRLMLTVPLSAARQPLQHLALLTGGQEPVTAGWRCQEVYTAGQ